MQQMGSSKTKGEVVALLGKWCWERNAIEAIEVTKA